MRDVRLFIDTPLEPEQTLALSETAARHAVQVLRLRAGDAVTLFNGDGHEYPATLQPGAHGTASAALGERRSPVRETPLQVTLLQALARGEKMDWIVQKATELGAVRIVPLVTERSEVHIDAARAARRVEHWRAIAIAACEQCGRNVLPVIDEPTALPAWLAAQANAKAVRWMLCPGHGMRLRVCGAPAVPVWLAIGPEGGLGERDLAGLSAVGFTALSLGPRVLRTETAGIAALAAVQALYGDLG